MNVSLQITSVQNKFQNRQTGDPFDCEMNDT